MTDKKKTLFEELYAINVNEKIEKKGQLKYLSWVFALAEIKKVDDAATIEVHEFPYIIGDQVIPGVMVPYLSTKEGVMVKVSVTVKGKTESEWLPVMDHKNQTLMNPKMTDINKAHKRCFAKAVAHHGLGLYIYAGEDLPEDEKPPAPDKQAPNAQKPPAKASKQLMDTVNNLVVIVAQKANEAGKEATTESVAKAFKVTANMTEQQANEALTKLKAQADKLGGTQQ